VILLILNYALLLANMCLHFLCLFLLDIYFLRANHTCAYYYSSYKLYVTLRSTAGGEKFLKDLW